MARWVVTTNSLAIDSSPMYLAPRALYGLHEHFVLFPFVFGARCSKLVLRASKLRHLSPMAGLSPKPVLMGAPLVLGELYGRDVFKTSSFVPLVVTGHGLNSLRYYGNAQWHFRWYQMQSFSSRSLRFEAGSKTRFAEHTQYYNIELLWELAKQGGPHEEEKQRPSDDRGPAAP